MLSLRPHHHTSSTVGPWGPKVRLRRFIYAATRDYPVMGCPVLVGSTQGLLSSVGRQVAPDGTFRDTEDFGYVCLAIAELGHHPNGVPPALVRVVFLTWVPALGVARGLAFAVSLKCQWLGSLMLGHHVVRLGPAAG